MKQAKFMWKLVNNYLPPSLSSNFKAHSIAIKSQFSTPAPRLDYASRHINYAGLKLWNSEVPLKIKQIKTFNSFSKTFHKHLLNEL